MKALTVRQPWAWAIFNAGKDVENRSWYTRFRGTVAVHAAQTLTRIQYNSACKYIQTIHGGWEIPPYEQLERGAVIGLVEIEDYVEHSESVWFEGNYGLVLRGPQLLHEPIPCKGGRKLWNVPPDMEQHIYSSVSRFDTHTPRTQNTKGPARWIA